MKSVFSVVMVLLVLSFTASAFATARVDMVPEPDKKSWTLQAGDFENVSGIDLTITYDSTVLGNPTVKEGTFIADSLMTSNANEQGTIRIAIVTTTPLSGGGPIIRVSFQRKAAGSPKIKLAAKIVNKDLAPAPVIPHNPPEQEGESAGTSSDTGTTQGGGQTAQPQKNQSQNNQPSTSGSSPIVYGGTVTMPSDTSLAAEEKRAQQPTSEYREEQHREAPSVTREKATPETRKEPEAKPPAIAIEPPVNILERFRTYKGEKTVKTLVDLFAVDEKAQVKQDPPILLADGKANLKLTVPNPQGKQAPNFALNKAKVVNLKVVDGAWVVVARPDKGVYDASVTMLVDDAAVEMPLIVAPKLDIDLDRSGKVTEEDFRIFLRDHGTEKAPKYDLNKDGRRDYLDDYLFTANYLVQYSKEKEMHKPAVTGSAGAGQKSGGGGAR